MGIFQQRRTFRPILCYLWFRGADPDFFSELAHEEKNQSMETVVELAASYIMEATRGEWMWDYTRFAFNFQGRVALNPSIRFGIGGMIFLYILQPLFEKGVRKMPERVIQAVSAILAILLCADVIYLFLK